MRAWCGAIVGELASKANSRKLVINPKTRRPMFIKSEKARAFVTAVQRQTPVLSPLLEGDLRVTAKIYYASRRPDLDAALLFDALQERIFSNDRQIKEIHLFHSLDPSNPRAVVKVEELSPIFSDSPVAL